MKCRIVSTAGGASPSPTAVALNRTKSAQQKRTDTGSVRSKGRPRSRASRAPSGFDSVPPVSFLSDTSFRATARNEPRRTAKRHRAKRRWNLGRDSAQDDAGEKMRNAECGMQNAQCRMENGENIPLLSFFKGFCGVLGGLFSKSSPNVPFRSPIVSLSFLFRSFFTLSRGKNA